MADNPKHPPKQLKVIGFYGRSGSGKTTLIERVLCELGKHGLSAAVIKQSCHEVGLDTPDKDTWRFVQAGARPVALHTDNESALFLPGEITLTDLVAMIAAIGRYRPDIILVEGAREENIPKVRIGNIKKRPNTVMDYADNFFALMEFILKEK